MLPALGSILALLLMVSAFVSFGWGMHVANTTWGSEKWGSTEHAKQAIGSAAVFFVLFVAAHWLARALDIDADTRSLAGIFSCLGAPLGYVLRKRYH
jgi:NhaP-type Na+/H+ or K+/H+ antiporter